MSRPRGIGLRGLALGLLLLLAGGALTLAALWAWAGSGQSLQWAWERVAPAHGLQAQALQGTLRDGLRAQRLRWVLEDWEVEAEDVAIEWRAQDLPALGQRGLLRVPLARIGTLRLIPRQRAGEAAPGASSPRQAPSRAPSARGPRPAPTRLTLPLNLQVDEARLGRFEVAGGWALSDVLAHYAYDGREHRVQLRQARMAHDTLGKLDLQGQARLGAQAPLPTELRLEGHWQRPASDAGTAAPQPLGLDLRAHGPLSLLDLHLLLRSPPQAGGSTNAPPQAEVRARVAPWSQPRWRAIDGRLSALDLADWWPKAPRTRLSGRFLLAPPPANTGQKGQEGIGSDLPGSLRLDLENALPGPWSEGRLPLARIEGQADLDANLLRALRLQMVLPTGDRWQMRLQSPVRWQRVQDGPLILGPGTLLLSTRQPPQSALLRPIRLAWDGLRWGPDELRTHARLSGLPLAWAMRALDLLPAGWRLRGDLEADVRVAGTGDRVRWEGELRADGLALRSVVDGIDLRDGQLRARLAQRQLLIDELQLFGPDLPGAPGSGGRLDASGEARWPAEGGASLSLDATLARLRASLRPDRLLTLSGQAHVEFAAREPASAPASTPTAHQPPFAAPPLQVEADLRVDQARIALPDHATPRLGPDVRVSGSAMPAPEKDLPLRLQARIDLGPDFRVTGRGLEARARGRLEAAGGASLDTLRLTGQVDMAGGHYRAFGQRLRLDRGLLRFTGLPLDPALDLLAIRPTPPGEMQRVGVQVTGRAQDPRVRLWSDPALPEAQALSWLAVGRASASGGGETALLEDLAVSMLTRRAGLGGGTLAQRLGLDELGVRRESAPGQGGGASGASGTSGTLASAGAGAAGSSAGTAQLGTTLAVGKRLARDIYAVYERGLSGALGTLVVFYEINRRLQLRVEAGDRTGVDLIYTVRVD